jgi:hypothetical protein
LLTPENVVLSNISNRVCWQETAIVDAILRVANEFNKQMLDRVVNAEEQTEERTTNVLATQIVRTEPQSKSENKMKAN